MSRNEWKIYFQILEPHTKEVGATAEQAGNRVTDRMMLTGQLGWQGGLEGKRRYPGATRMGIGAKNVRRSALRLGRLRQARVVW